MKYKAIIFDMDGTIVDTEHIWGCATKQLIESKGIKITKKLEKELCILLRGVALIKSCEIIKNILNINENIEDLIVQKSQIAQKLYNTKINFIPGFLQFHKKLINHNLKIGIATNADDVTLKLTNKALNLEKLFGEHIYNISHVNNIYKPNPDVYLHAAKQLDVSPNLCIAIEDSKYGIKAAKAAGMFCIGINTSKNKDLLVESDLIIDHYNEINLTKLLNV